MINNGTINNSGTLTNTSVFTGTGDYIQSIGTTTNTGSFTQSTLSINGGVFEQQAGSLSATTIAIASGGVLSFSGGTLTSTLTGAGTVNVLSGATLSGTNTLSGPTMNVSGTARNVTLNSGTLNVNSGGVTNDTTLNGGSQVVKTGGLASGTTINGGVQTVNAGGTALGTTILGGTQNVSGTATSTSIAFDGTQNVNAGGTANLTTINGGTQNVSAGGLATNTTINGGLQSVTGTAESTTINGGTQNINSGGIADLTTINSGGTQNVNAGGVAINTTINGGWQIVSGTATTTAINSGGLQDVYPDGRAIDTTVSSGGTQTVHWHGTATSTVLNGGTQDVQGGGTADTTTVNSGGVQNISLDATAKDSTVNSGGTLNLAAGGILQGTTLINGTGAFNASPTVINRGTLTFNNTDTRSYSFSVIDAGAGTAGITKCGTGALTLTGDTVQPRGITLQGGSLTLQGGTHATGSAPSLTLSGGSAEMHAVLTDVTLVNATLDLFVVDGVTNPANTLTINNLTLTQPLDATAGNGLLLYGTNGGRVAFTANNSTLEGAMQFGGAGVSSVFLASSSKLTGVVTGGPNMTIDSSSQWIMTGNSDLGTLTLAGTIVSRNDGTPFAPKTLTLNGLNGGQALSGGTIKLNTVLGNSLSPSDKIVMNGAVTGTTKLFINNVGGLGASTAGTDGILLVQALTGASTAASRVNPGFFLINGPINVGAFTYSLRPGNLFGQGQNWYLTTDAVPFPIFISADSASSSPGTSLPATVAGALSASGPVRLSGTGPSTFTLSGVTLDTTALAGAKALVEVDGAGNPGNTVTFTGVRAVVLSRDGLLISSTNGGNLSFTADSSTLAGDIVFSGTSTGSVTLSNHSTLTGSIDPVNLAIDGSSQWVMTGSSVLDNLTLAGSIVFQAPAGAFTPKTLTVSSLTGQNGAITLNTSLGDENSPSDMIVVDGGAVTGTTRLAINNVGGLGAQTMGNGIRVVQAVNGADTTAQGGRNGFVLNAPVYAGSFLYLLRPGDALGLGQDWYLTSMVGGPGGGRTNYRPDVSLFASLIGLSQDLMGATLGTAHVREGESVEKVSSGGLTAWTRGLGSLMRREGGGSVSPGFEGYTDGFQVGAELGNVSSSGNTSAFGVYGAMVYGNAQGWGDSLGARFTSVGRMDMTAYSAGVYGTYQWAGKGYADAALQGSILGGHSYGSYNVKVNGRGWAASLSGGYPFKLGDSHFTLEPQVQGTYQQASFDGVSLSNTHGELQGGSRLTLRGGARLKYEAVTERGVRWVPSLAVNIRHDEDSNAKVVMTTPSASTSLPTNFSGTVMELIGGLTVQVNDRWKFYGQAGGFTSVDGKSSRGAQASVGLKMTF